MLKKKRIIPIAFFHELDLEKTKLSNIYLFFNLMLKKKRTTSIICFRKVDVEEKEQQLLCFL